MRRLRLLLAGRNADGERGAVLILTAALTMFVAIALLALTVDLGNVTYHRAQLQNGADASSLALATACAKKQDCGVSPSLTKLAIDNANVPDQEMAIDGAPKTCIGGKPYDGITTLTTCPNSPSAEDTSSVSNCQPWPLAASAADVRYVEVTTKTQMKNGSSVLPYYFGQLLGGGKGTTQETCARAAWGPAGSTGPTIPATISQCAYNDAIKNGLAPAPDYTPAPNASTKPAPPAAVQPYITKILLHTTNSNDACTTTPGQTYPGGFGWLTTSNDNTLPGYPCVADIVAGGPATGDTSGGTGNGNTGRPPPQACKSNTLLQSYVGKIVGVPIYNGYNGTGAGGTYNIVSIAAFYLAGYVKVNSLGDYSVYNPSGVCPACNGSDTYMWGWFTDAVLPNDGGTIGSGPDYGAHVVVPAG